MTVLKHSGDLEALDLPTLSDEELMGRAAAGRDEAITVITVIIC
ncbi:MAG TPA: hypothetical protein VEK33_25935 [Terriglobales bacterium]|nr:hypothetical protein [Terriglobales bacterium]